MVGKFFAPKPHTLDMLKLKSEIARELQIHTKTLRSWCIRFKFWEKSDMRKLIGGQEAQNIIKHFGSMKDE